MGNRRRYVRVLSAFVLIVFPFFVSYGAYIGSKSRVEFEEYERREALRDAQLLEQFKVKMEVFRYERTKEIDAQYSGNSSTGSALAPEIDPLLPAIESD